MRSPAPARPFAGVSTVRLVEGLLAADEILAEVLRADEELLRRITRASDDDLEAIERELVQAIADEWSGRIPGALDAALEDLAGGVEAGLFTEAELARIVQVVGAKMMAGLVESVTAAVGEGIGGAYGIGRQVTLNPLQMEIVWNLVDERVQAALRADTLYWVGSAWDRQLGGQIADVIRQEVIEKGLGRKDAAAELERIFGEEFPGRSRAYWEVVASAGVVRARSFGAVESFVQAEAITYTWNAVNDSRTCPLCAEMDGRTFTVRRAVEIRDAFLAADGPEAAKAAHPWATLPDVVGKSDKELEDAGFVLPPLHGRDRCVVTVGDMAGD